jgi:hypothetical protein
MQIEHVENVRMKKKTQRETKTVPVRIHAGVYQLLKDTDPGRSLSYQVTTLLAAEVTKRINLENHSQGKPTITQSEMFELSVERFNAEQERKAAEAND